MIILRHQYRQYKGNLLVRIFKTYGTSNYGICLAKTVAISLLMGIIAMSPVCASEGVFLMGNDTLQVGRASSGVASPRSSYWCLMNPAAMVDLERRFDVNLYAIMGNSRIKPKGVLVNSLDGNLHSDKLSLVVANSIILPLKTGVLGGGLFIPSGSAIEYPNSRSTITRLFQGNRDRRLAYQHIRGVLAYAYEFDNGWALGMGVHLSLSRFRSDHITLGFRPAKHDNRWDDALGIGFGLGVYRSWERFSVGLAYNSRHWTQSMKKYKDLLKHCLDLPQTVQAGIAYKVTPKLELTLDYKWLNWKEIKTYGTPIFSGGGYGWRDQHGIKTGLEWVAHPKWTFMCGYSYSNSPVTQENVFLAGLVPVVVKHHISAGVSHKITEKHSVHLAGVYAPPCSIKETGRGNSFSKLSKGSSVQSSGYSVMIGYTYFW